MPILGFELTREQRKEKDALLARIKAVPANKRTLRPDIKTIGALQAQIPLTELEAQQQSVILRNQAANTRAYDFRIALTLRADSAAAQFATYQARFNALSPQDKIASLKLRLHQVEQMPGDLKGSYAYVASQYRQALTQGAPRDGELDNIANASARQLAQDNAPSGFDSFLQAAVPLALGAGLAFIASPAIAGAFTGTAGAAGTGVVDAAATAAGADIVASQGVIASMSGAGISDALVAQSIAGAAASVSTTAAAATAEMAGASWGTLVTGNVASIGTTAMQLAQNLPTPPKMPTSVTPPPPTPQSAAALPTINPSAIAEQVAQSGVKIASGIAATAITSAVLPPPVKPTLPVAPIVQSRTNMGIILLSLLGVGAAVYLL